MADDQDPEELNSPEDTYDMCDNCREYHTLTSCPAQGEVIKYTFVPDNICEECCRESFLSDPDSCLMYFEDCPRVGELQLEILEELAKKHSFEKSKKFPPFFMNTQNTMGVGGHDANPSKYFEGTKMESDLYYDGKEFSFVQVKGEKFAYNKELVDEALDILDEIGEEVPTRLIIKKDDLALLVLQGNRACAIVGNLDLDYPYSLEKSEFLSSIFSGYEIFKEDLKKEIVLFDLAQSNLNWKALNFDEFEELGCAVLSSFDTISNCVRASGSGDEGRDIIATETIKTITGTEQRSWLVQCKHYPDSVISREEIDNIDNLKKRFNFDVYCLMTSGKFGPNSMRLLDAFAKDHIIKRMDKQFLESHLMKHPEILQKFPKLCSE